MQSKKVDTTRTKTSLTVTGIFLLLWIALAFNVHNRADWFLENILVIILIGPSIFFYLKGHISTKSFLLIFIFLTLHCVGAHYTYSLVPYDVWSMELFGRTINDFFNWERNHYDRLIHLLWGFLIYKPLEELFSHHLKLKGRTLVVFSLFAIIATSTAYELIEWLAAKVFGGELGAAYVGSQGDIWNSQKDQALAILGAILAIFLL